jgi:hypothetical protein
MRTRCGIYWDRFVACQLQANNARNEPERAVWLQVAESWLSMARAEMSDAHADLALTGWRRDDILN